MSEYFVEFNTV